jgi:hypothetical protein
MLLAFLMFPYSNNAPEWTKWLDLACGILGVATIAWAVIDTYLFIRRSTVPDLPDVIFGIIAIVLILEVSRRTAGNVFTGVVAFFLLYTLYGNYFPSVFARFPCASWEKPQRFAQLAQVRRDFARIELLPLWQSKRSTAIFAKRGKAGRRKAGAERKAESGKPPSHERRSRPSLSSILHPLSSILNHFDTSLSAARRNIKPASRVRKRRRGCLRHL